MVEPRTAAFQSGADDAAKLALNSSGGSGKGDAYPVLRQLGGRAYQLLAAARAADHFIAQEDIEDRDTGSWLIAYAVGLAEEMAADLDGLAKNLKGTVTDPTMTQAFQKMRARAHQLHATTRASDHFLEQDNNVDRSTGSWLIASSLTLADKLANELEELANGLRRTSSETAPSATEAPGRRTGAASAARAATV
jgi:hypothetical protein